MKEDADVDATESSTDPPGPLVMGKSKSLISDGTMDNAKKTSSLRTGNNEDNARNDEENPTPKTKDNVKGKVVDNKNEDDEEEEDDMIELEEDIYSMLFVNGFGWNPPSVYCMGIIALQLTIIALFYFDLLHGGSRENKLDIPLKVSAQVRATEFLALPLAIMAHTTIA